MSSPQGKVNKKQLTDLTGSLLALPQGLSFILSHKWSWKYIITAVFLNCLSLIVSLLGITLLNNYLLTNLFARLDVELGVVLTIGYQLTGFLVALLLVYLGFGFLSSIANAPIYGQLAGKMSEKYAANLNRRNAWQDIFYSLSFELRKSLVIAVIFIVSIPLNFIPVVGQIVFLMLNTFQVVVITGLDLFEPVLSNRGLSFRDKVKFIIENPLRYWPFLLTAGTLCAIPIVNIFLIPICIAGAMRLVVTAE